jgi:hypothetical protein
MFACGMLGASASGLPVLWCGWGALRMLQAQFSAAVRDVVTA